MTMQCCDNKLKLINENSKQFGTKYFVFLTKTAGLVNSHVPPIFCSERFNECCYWLKIRHEAVSCLVFGCFVVDANNFFLYLFYPLRILNSTHMYVNNLIFTRKGLQRNALC